MRSTKVGRAGRRLILLSKIAAVLETVAAANLTLTYILYTFEHPDIGIAGFVPIMAIGAVPFLVTAGLLAWAVRSDRPSEGDQLSRQAVRRLRMITGFGLPFMILGGLWSGLAAALLGLDVGSAAGNAVTVYQFTFLAAVIADVITLAVALTTRTAP
jgi:hypothetical protein